MSIIIKFFLLEYVNHYLVTMFTRVSGVPEPYLIYPKKYNEITLRMDEKHLTICTAII